jgi:N-acetylglucosaminyldiphosphoundecaprenol N-acetyl-beta-D-mannosaminyltransferase
MRLREPQVREGSKVSNEVSAGQSGAYRRSSATGLQRIRVPNSVSTHATVTVAFAPASSPVAKVHEIDDFDLESFLPIAARFGQDRYGFVVTPNVDHMIRFHEDAQFRDCYKAASFVLLDSRFAARLVRLFKGVKLPVCTGSDLTLALLSRTVQPSDRIVLIGGSEEQAAQIAARFGLVNVRHYNPPMGFIKSPAAVEECLHFIETSGPFRFCFLAVGCPQQEVLAERLQARGIARGLALCVGASLNFVAGREQRAPVWMQRLALEWLFRLIQDPKRLASRYLVRGPRIFALLRRSRFILRRAAAPAV